ncbi:serpentine type 7TM GPCR chemoreceptor srt domain-containing protein [Ditylenchus destructor]|uniref:Serpentine type 7TM GPCR chemoreceptor srt domain-containing protein n=1 Tax=Ditylenchus destructor TaxID=166010 RepID=A0AAD4MI28_9BILA|nr:serpentine type 7TM GPCR chemoreceptor srt domain-containing protein [Ditylenchus destructor]
MELYLFRHPEWEELYHCTYDIDIIPLEKRVHEIHGVLMIALATIFLVIYIPTLSVIMCKFLDKAAYQLMFLIGFSDVLILIVAGLTAGVWSFEGYVFCTQPTLIYVTGCIGTGFWVLSTESSAILALYRCLELWRPFVANSLFKGRRTLIWICIALFHSTAVFLFGMPVIYGSIDGFWVLSTESSAILAFYRCLELWRPFVADSLFKGRRTFLWIGFSLCHFTGVFFFGMPVIYSSIDGTFSINPHAGYIEDTEGKFFNPHHRYYNIALFFVLIGQYSALVYLMICKERDHAISRQTLSAQYKALIQALIICSCEAISDAYWVIVLRGPAPPQIVVFIGMYTWICSHGVPGLIYISMNKSVRDSIFNVLKIKKRVTPSRNAVFDSSVNPPAQLFNVIIV